MILVKKIAQRIFSVGFKVRGSINYMNVVGCEWTHLRFVAAATIVRANCHDSSCQLPR